MSRQSNGFVLVESLLALMCICIVTLILSGFTFAMNRALQTGVDEELETTWYVQEDSGTDEDDHPSSRSSQTDEI